MGRRWIKTYVITGTDKSLYITRTVFPRVLGRRLLLHRIHRPDLDEHPHNHPWSFANFRILSGGYVEERLLDAGTEYEYLARTLYLPGDVNRLKSDIFHRIVELRPDTWTIGVLGSRVQDWGFLVNGEITPWREYLGIRP